MKRDFRYIFRRVIAGILIGLFFIGFKSCEVHATAFPSSESLIYVNTQNCNTSSNSPYDISCTKGTVYKYLFQMNSSTNNSTYITPMIINNSDYDVLVNSIVYDIRFDTTYTIDSTYKNVYFAWNWEQSSLLSYMDRSGIKIAPNFMPNNSLDLNANVDKSLNVPSMYGLVPYFCSYYDTDLQELQTCNMTLNNENWSNGFRWLVDLPVGTHFNRIVVYYGTDSVYTGTSKSWTPIDTSSTTSYRLPNSDTFYKFDNYWRRNELNNYGLAAGYGISYSQYYDNVRYNSYTPVGIWWYPKGNLLQTPEFTLPDSEYFIQYNNANYTTGYTKTFKTIYNSSQQEALNDSVNQMEQDYQSQQPSEEENGYDWWNAGFLSFSNNTYVDKFTGLFSALFTYPLQKVYGTLSEDLVQLNTGMGSGSRLNDAVCWGRIDSATSKQPHKIYITKDYYFNFPCPHVDIYPHLKSGNFGFYPNNFHGASLSGSQYDFATLYQTIIDGLLIYFLFIQVLEVYKYVIDPTNTQVEVLEL